MSNRNHVWGRPRAAVLLGGLGVVLALAAAGCGSGGSSSSTTQTSTPASSPSTSTPSSTETTSTSATTTPAQSGLSGKWKGTYSGTYSGTFTLNWTQTSSKLSGTIDLSTGGTTNVHGTVDGSSIKFGTVGGGQVITYTGTVSGSSMSGSYNTPGGGGSWSAHKS